MTKFLIDFFPLAAFFIAYKLLGIYWATGILMLACSIQALLYYLRSGKLEKKQQYLLGAVLIFGALTLLLHDDRVIKLKVTVVFWVIAGILMFRQMVSHRYSVQDIFESAISASINAPKTLWSRLNIVWIAVNFGIGLANLYVAFVLAADNNDVWINFKVWGITAIEILLMLYTVFVLNPYLPNDETSEKP